MIFFKRELITRHDDTPYLERLRVFDSAWFGVYLHRFLASDDPCLHDHPWPFVSVILRSGYWETVGHHWGQAWGSLWWWLNMPTTWYPAGSILFRRAEHAHRIELDPARPLPVTLVIRGPRGRVWGFFGNAGWVPWRKYDHAKHCV